MQATLFYDSCAYDTFEQSKPSERRGTMADLSWMLYGVTGKTGRMVLNHALERGHRPVIAGRNAEKVRELAELHALPWESFDLRDSTMIDSFLAPVDLVVNMAGPYTSTAVPIVQAAIRAGTDYIDVSGELSVFQALLELDDDARGRNVMILPGCGFEIVPSDALALRLAERMPEAVSLELAISSANRISAGTFKAATGVIADGGFVRRNGELVPEPLGTEGPNVRFHQGERKTIHAPLPDLVSAWWATGIGEITTLFALPPGAGFARHLGPSLQRALRIRPLRRLLNASATLGTSRSTELNSDSGSGSFWGRVTAKDGRTVEAWIETGEPYTFTACAVIQGVELCAEETRPGFQTPATAFGVDFAENVSGNTITFRLPI